QHERRPPQSRAAGKVAVRDAGEDIEALGGAADGLRYQLARDPREREAVAGEALQEGDVGSEPSEVRRAVDRNVDVAAPGVVHAHPIELRKDAQHACTRGARSIEGLEARIVDAAAEEKAVIRGTPEIIEHPVHVTHRGVVRDELPRALKSER